MSTQSNHLPRREGPNCGSRQYPKRTGLYWNLPPINENNKWTDDPELFRNPVIPEEFKGRQLSSYRTGLDIGVHRKLSEEEKMEIVHNARTREDFHDLNKIMSPPSWGFCLCELRIISGQRCLNFLSKDEDGANGKTPKEGESHWGWFIDPCPRGEMCPIAKQRHWEREDSISIYEPCDILIAKPTSEWALAQHEDDPKGTIAGRVSTDMWLKSKCPGCLGYYVDGTNHIRDLQTEKWDVEKQEHFLPKDWDPAESDWLVDMPPDWPRNLAVQPCQFVPQESFTDYHPVLKPTHFYHYFALYHLGVTNEHIWLPGKEMTYQQWWAEVLEEEKERIKASRAQQIEDSKKALAEIEHDLKREQILKRLMEEDTKQYY